MPTAPLRPCSFPGCPSLVSGGGSCPIHRRGSAASRGYGAAHRRLRVVQLRREPWCRDCGARATVADHIVPRSLGGADDLTNLQSLCTSCHNRKTRLDGSSG